MRITTVLAVAREGSARVRRRVISAGLGARRLAMMQAGLATGVLDALEAGAKSTDELVARLEVKDPGVLDGFLRVLTADGLVRGGSTAWRLSRLGRALVDDDLIRGLCEAFDGYHSDLYRALPEQLRSGARRRDVADRSELIARASQLFEPLMLDELTKTLSEVGAQRVLDVGCGSGAALVHLLASAPQARGIGIDVSSAAIALAARTCAEAGVSRRVDLATGDAADLLVAPGGVVQADSIDLAVAANVVYYLKTEHLRRTLRAVVTSLRPGGVLLVVTTDLDDSLMSRHFDLLLRAQTDPMGLIPRGELVAELERAGLRVDRTKRLVPGEPLLALHAVKPTPLSV